MQQIIEVLLLLVLASLGIWCSYTDIKTGLIPNRILKRYLMTAAVLDILYYGFFVQDTFFLFLINAASVTGLSLFLYLIHRFAGGDMKLAFVMSLLFPSRFILTFMNTDCSLWLTLPLAMIWGYFFLLADTLTSIFKRNHVIDLDQMKKQFLSFLWSFFRGSLYILFINQIVLILSVYGFDLNVWIVRTLCLLMGYLSSKKKILNNISVLTLVFGIDIFLCCLTGQWPFTVHPENYLVILFLFVSNSLISTRIYEDIKPGDLKKGMILSFETSLVLQKSRIKNLPCLSSEDLRSRLSQEEVDAIKRFAASEIRKRQKSTAAFQQSKSSEQSEPDPQDLVKPYLQDQSGIPQTTSKQNDNTQNQYEELQVIDQPNSNIKNAQKQNSVKQKLNSQKQDSQKQDLKNKNLKNSKNSSSELTQSELTQPEFTIRIVKKIPFAPFLALGFLTYFILWRMI